MNSLNDQTQIFDLSKDAIGQILHHFNLETGSKNFVNKADISIVMKYARSLACTSSYMNLIINDQEVTSCFLNSLSNKYGQIPAHYAALFNTMGARLYIWNYIKEVGDDKNYQIIQEIYDLASTILQDTKEAGLKFDSSVCRDSPNPFYDQTKQGFFLNIDSSPSYLSTPFGKIDIYRTSSYSGRSPLSVSEMFIKKLKATFEQLSYIKEDRVIYQIISSSESSNIRIIGDAEMKKIRIGDLERNKGSQSLITTSYCGEYSIYNIHEVNGKKTPEVQNFDSHNVVRSYKLINCIWKMLDRNNLGLNPIEKELKDVNSTPKSIENQTSMLKSLDEVTRFCMDRVIQLDSQPIFKGKSWHNIPTKLLLMESDRDAKLVEILNEGAGEFSEIDSCWNIHVFGGNDRRYLNGKDLGTGLELWMYKKKSFRCDLPNLKIAYESVLKTMSLNWHKTELKMFPNILHTESEEDYELFVKTKGAVRQEMGLINCIAYKLEVSDYINCQDNWKGSDSSGIYLWIKKGKLENVLNALKIQI